MPERTCSPARCQINVVTKNDDNQNRAKPAIYVPERSQVDLNRDYAVPFRGDVERIQALCGNNNSDNSNGGGGGGDVSARFEFATVCKNYTPRSCDPNFEDCGTREICYKKPRVVRATNEDGIRTNCREKRSLSSAAYGIKIIRSLKLCITLNF